MAITDVDLVNRALHKLGQKEIAALTDDSKAARLANDTFDEYRDDLLRAHPWNFASVRHEITNANATAPEWGYDNAFDLPTSSPVALRVLSVNGENEHSQRWKVESANDVLSIVTDISEPLEVLLIQQVTDPDLMEPMFREVLVSKLAFEWAESLTGMTEVRDRMERDYIGKLALARSIDGQEGIPDRFESDEWLDVRW